VNQVLFAPTRSDFISSRWLCRLGHFIGIGNTLCFPDVKAKFLENTMTGQFIASFTLAFIGGFIIAFPYVFWEFWKFVRPALSQTERKKTKGVIFWVSLLFFTGVAFGYFILTPFMVNFYFNYKLSPQDRNNAIIFRLPGKPGVYNSWNRCVISNAIACNGAGKDRHCYRSLPEKIPASCFCHYINCSCDHHSFH
jgi:hypothetical protein